jgi:hypothetical protein
MGDDFAVSCPPLDPEGAFGSVRPSEPVPPGGDAGGVLEIAGGCDSTCEEGCDLSGADFDAEKYFTAKTPPITTARKIPPRMRPVLIVEPARAAGTAVREAAESSFASLGIAPASSAAAGELADE